MKTYAIVAIRKDNRNVLGAPILTCSEKAAVSLKRKLIKEQKDSYFYWDLWQYEIKTQGKNFEQLCFARPYKDKEPQ